jgi:hypothetical protein
MRTINEKENESREFFKKLREDSVMNARQEQIRK